MDYLFRKRFLVLFKRAECSVVARATHRVTTARFCWSCAAEMTRGVTWRSLTLMGTIKKRQSPVLASLRAEGPLISSDPPNSATLFLCFYNYSYILNHVLFCTDELLFYFDNDNSFPHVYFRGKKSDPSDHCFCTLFQ